MKVDIILVGPWERVSENGKATQDFINYIKKIRQCNKIGLINYSSTDADNIVDNKLFDKVYSNEFLINRKHSGIYYYENSRIAILEAENEFIIRLRSDIRINNIDEIISIILQNKEKIIIDYHIEHTLLIPYYYSDFFLASNKLMMHKLYEKEMNLLLNDVKKISLSPYKFLTIGRFKNNFNNYNESMQWHVMLKNIGLKNIKLMHEYKFIDYLYSLKLLKENFILVNRNYLYKNNKRFIFKRNPNLLVFNKYICVLSTRNIILMYAIHLCLYLQRSLNLILNKCIIQK